MRKQYSPHFKADTVLEAFKEDLTIAQLGSDKQVHPNQIHAWKAHAQRELHTLFEPHAQREAVLKTEHKKNIPQHYAEIGRLTTQDEWLKKKSGVETLPE